MSELFNVLKALVISSDYLLFRCLFAGFVIKIQLPAILTPISVGDL